MGISDSPPGEDPIYNNAHTHLKNKKKIPQAAQAVHCRHTCQRGAGLRKKKTPDKAADKSMSNLSSKSDTESGNWTQTPPEKGSDNAKKMLADSQQVWATSVYAFWNIPEISVIIFKLIYV